jgi:hypothetical protein
LPRKFKLLVNINTLNLVKLFHIHLFLSYKESTLCSTEVSKFKLAGHSETGIIVLPFYQLQLAAAEPTHHPGVSLTSGLVHWGCKAPNPIAINQSTSRQMTTAQMV